MESYKLVNFSKYSFLKVTEASIEEVLTSDPFLLVYERTCKYSKLCVDLRHSYVLYFFIDNHSHSLSLNKALCMCILPQAISLDALFLWLSPSCIF